MSLRVYQARGAFDPEVVSPTATPMTLPADASDGWATRLAKLIPAEALGLYGIASAQVPPADGAFTAGARLVTLWIVALVCASFSAAIRIRATSAGGKPQWTAVIISVASFLVWLTAVGPPGSPVQLPTGFVFVGPLVAVIWATLVSYFYRGDPA